MKTICLRIKFGILLLSVFGFLMAQHVPENFKNPIIPGYHPDPSVCRVGDDYYLVNSSFEWYPGLPVFHSKDLVNWELIGYGVHRPNQVELPVGLGDSRGTYAATIRHHEGVFYIINTCVQCNQNFYITATNPAGPWSDPVWLGSHGIDPDLFWDDDGRCYYTGHGFRGEKRQWPMQEGAWMQELDLKQGKLVGPWKQLTYGHASNARWTEGPHIYKIDGKYLLLMAEGGTGFHHGVTVFNSDSLWGPYIPNHSNPVITHRNLGNDYPIHSIGHADLVQIQNGEWWAVMLGKRLVDGHTMLARETFLTPVKFENQEDILTPVFNPGIAKIVPEQKRPDLPWSPFAPKPARDDFECSELALEWNFLRTPFTKWYELKNGNLILQLRPEAASELVNPSLIARRIMHHNFVASVSFTFESKKTTEEAGMILYRNSKNFITITKKGNQLILTENMRGTAKTKVLADAVEKDMVVKVESFGTNALIYAGSSECCLKKVGETKLIMLTDEVALGFNGPFVGMYATANGQPSKAKASFAWFEYVGK
jgi:xylan 1,4-beta-xylosidase